jgi:hypothetical protein
MRETGLGKECYFSSFFCHSWKTECGAVMSEEWRLNNRPAMFCNRLFSSQCPQARNAGTIDCSRTLLCQNSPSVLPWIDRRSFSPEHLFRNTSPGINPTFSAGAAPEVTPLAPIAPWIHISRYVGLSIHTSLWLPIDNHLLIHTYRYASPEVHLLIYKSRFLAVEWERLKQLQI